MAVVVPPSDQAAGLLEKLSLNSFTEAPGSTKNAVYSDNGAIFYPQGYGYAPFGTYPLANSPVLSMNHDGQLYGTHYHYPGQFYQPAASPSMIYSPNISNAAQRDFPSLATDGGPLSTRNSNYAGSAGFLNKNTGVRPTKTSNQIASSNISGSYKRGIWPAAYTLSGYQDLRFGYDGYQSLVPWLDTSMVSNRPSRHTTGFSSPASSHLSRLPSGMGQTSGYMNLMYADDRIYNQYGHGVSGAYGYNSWIDGHRWTVVPNRNKSQGSSYGTENTNCLNELNRGPRAKGLKNQTEHVSVTQKAGKKVPFIENTKEDNPSRMPENDKYNGENLHGDYSDAKFFVIKSYSEDDIHKSIKYGMWSSTPNGNQKLDAAYRLATENGSGCPVFLLFSVNTSGQFVGLAEMIGPVEFNKTLDCWQQEKWIGCFPVKWHLIKDVPNSSLRHITLENNENKPVTNSRDTQEVALEKGLQIVKIFKGHKVKTSVLDDFGFYQVRERIMQEKRAKQKMQNQALDGKPHGNTSDGREKVASIGKDDSQNASELNAEPVALAATAQGVVKN